MTLLHLALRSLMGRPFRNLLVGLFVLVLTAFLLGTTVILRGMEKGLRAGMERLGPDIVVIPFDVTERAQSELLAGKLVTGDSMPYGSLQRIREMEAVGRASPQLHLLTIAGGPYSKSEELFIVAFDPETDFTILPWLRGRLAKPMGGDDAVGGTSLTIEPSERFSINGYHLALTGKLEPTGIWFDQTVFVSFGTAHEMIGRGAIPGELSAETVTAIAVDLKQGYDAARTAIEMLLVAPGVWAVRAPKLMTTLASQRAGLIQSLFLALGIIWALAVVLTGFVFSIIVHERRREIGMLRAVGATRNFIFRLFLMESAFPAIGGGLVGIILSTLLLYSVGPRLGSIFNMELLLPSLPGLGAATMGSFAVAQVLVLPGIFYPALRASRLDPAVAMRGV